jgi:hypothetical protein
MAPVHHTCPVRPLASHTTRPPGLPAPLCILSRNRLPPPRPSMARAASVSLSAPIKRGDRALAALLHHLALAPLLLASCPRSHLVVPCGIAVARRSTADTSPSIRRPEAPRAKSTPLRGPQRRGACSPPVSAAAGHARTWLDAA